MPRIARFPAAPRRVVLSSVAALLLVAGLTPGAAGQGVPAPTEPHIELIPGSERVVYEREKGDAIFLDPGIHFAVTEAPFEIRLQRDDYASGIDVWQVLAGPGGESHERPLPTDVMAGWDGLDDFFHVMVHNRDDELAAELTTDFCPNAYELQRVNDEGPQSPTYPASCGGSYFTKGIVWGIDEGWASRIYDLSSQPMHLRAGLYRVTLSITPRYIELFSIDPTEATAQVELRVKTVDYGEFPYGGKPPPPLGRPTQVPTIEPDPAILPDLVPFPAWSMQVVNGRNKVRLNFSATVGVEGASALVVEGFRRSGERIMDAFQYFYSGGEVVGRAPVGAMEYDERDGHAHWHFQQFARYSLLDADLNEIAPSRKEAFCLASTDAIDLLLPGASWRVFNTDLSTACGSEESLWVREILPLGWADTYSQSLPGQSFDITDLPNGKYFVSVEANPGGLLYEQNLENNVELREIYLRGRGSERRVVVPPWNGIDTEGGGSGEGKGDHSH